MEYTINNYSPNIAFVYKINDSLDKPKNEIK